jgi:hypothetical protein
MPPALELPVLRLLHQMVKMLLLVQILLGCLHQHQRLLPVLWFQRVLVHLQDGSIVPNAL